MGVPSPPLPSPLLPHPTFPSPFILDPIPSSSLPSPHLSKPLKYRVPIALKSVGGSNFNDFVENKLTKFHAVFRPAGCFRQSSQTSSWILRVLLLRGKRGRGGKKNRGEETRGKRKRKKGNGIGGKRGRIKGVGAEEGQRREGGRVWEDPRLDLPPPPEKFPSYASV